MKVAATSIKIKIHQMYFEQRILVSMTIAQWQIVPYL